VPMQEIDSSDEAQEDREETWIKLLKNDNCEGSVSGQML
jgi:hypothetical protein